MRKIISFLMVAVLCFVFSNHGVEASGILPKKEKVDDILIVDNPAWTGTKYNGVPANFSNTVIGLNINYIKGISVSYGKIFVKLPNDATAKTQMAARIAITIGELGDNSFKAVMDNFNAWDKSARPNNAPLIKFEDSGIVVNSRNHSMGVYSQYRIVSETANGSKVAKSVPDWTFSEHIGMTIDEYNKVFAPALESWISQHHFLVKTKDYPIEGGRLIQYSK